LDYKAAVPLESIAVPENRLRELRDYSGLATSMAKVGLLQPITVTKQNVLVAGRHRLEAARSLGWKTIPAFVVEEDTLANRLQEIDENLKRLDLTVWEQSKHAEERERVLEAMGERAKRGDNRHSRPATVAGLDQDGAPATVAGARTTADVANEAGMSERSWQQRTKIGRALGPKTSKALDMADPSEEKHRNFLNSTTQLNHLADISNKRGDERAAETAEKVLNGEFKSTFDAYPEVKEEAAKEPPVGEIIGADHPAWTLEWDVPPEGKEYRNVVKWVDRVMKLDAEKIASYCKDDYEATRDLEHVRDMIGWFFRYEAALEKRRKDLKPGNLRAVN
jgi:ParB-like chromosome segregation protein Spo0J